MKRFRKKPVVIEAVQFTGGESGDAVTQFLGGYHAVETHRWKSNTEEGGFILTLEGEMEFGPRDWIIKGIKGEFYPCRDDIFQATYEEI